MKVLIHLFTIYMLALSLLPCGDGGGGILDIAQHLLGIEHQKGSDHEQHSNTCGDDFCSPFCACSCCSIALDSPVEMISFDFSLIPVLGTISSFVATLPRSLFSTAVWQPPQLA